MAGKSIPPTPVPAGIPLTVTELIARYWKFVCGYYVKGGQPTSEQHVVKSALRFVRKLYGSTPAAEFSPKKLTAVREAMLVHPVSREVAGVDPSTGETVTTRKIYRRGLARTCINKLVGRIRRMFAWAVAEELVPVDVHAALLRVPGLRRGKSPARETPRVKPAADAAVDAALLHLPPMIAAMVRVQRLCGCRPQEVVRMRAADIDRSGAVWEYRPPRYKTEHHNEEDSRDLDRVVYLGPRAQAVLTPLLPDDPQEYVFSPRRSEAERGRTRREARVSPMTPSQTARRPKGRAKAPLGDAYLVSSYRRAIFRACQKAGVAVWVPNQLRHARLTEIRKSFGLEASRVVGGHREVGTTQHYAEQDRDRAREVMAEVG